MKDTSDYSLSFTVESGEIIWLQGGIKKSSDFINEGLKLQLTKKKIFKINSLIYNVESQTRETNVSLDCSYNDVRQISATIIKNMINKEGYSSQWLNLNNEIKTAVKNNILSTLDSNDIDILKAAAFTVAGICKIEIPQNQWLNIIGFFSNCIQSKNLYVQLKSLMCLEYIFEDINRSDFSEEMVLYLFKTFCSLLNKDQINESLCIYALKAILKFQPFIKEVVKVKMLIILTNQIN